MKYESLCFSGGGIKGIMHLGALSELNERDLLDVKEVSGTSVGSIIATAIAMKYSMHTILNLLFEINFKDNMTIDIVNFLQTKGISSIDSIKNLVVELITIENKHDVTFLELYNKTNIELHICSTDIDNFVPYYFNYSKTPEVKIIDAILASVSIPFIFPPVNINDKKYVDGILTDDIPYGILKNKDDMLIFCFDKEPENTKDEDTVISYIKKIFMCTVQSYYNRIFENVNKNKIVVFEIDNSLVNKNLDSLFDIDIDDKMTLFYNGKKQIIKFLNNLN